MSDTSPFTRMIDVAAVPDGGIERHLEWSADERTALAEEFGLLSLDALAADVRIVPWQGEGFAVTGRIAAVLRQSCVVSLVPVEQLIDEPFEVHFVPGASRPDAGKPSRDVVVEVSDDEPPEVFSGHAIDVGSVVLEHFALAIDPYPRAPGAELSEPAASADSPERSESPFAVLAKLKKQDS